MAKGALRSISDLASRRDDLKAAKDGLGGLRQEILRTCALSGGDDYELVFTAPASARGAVEQAGIDSATRVTRIGRIDAQAGLRIVDASGAPVSQRFGSFDHFV
jgi:thiamine-monophosphate kinase